MNNNEKNNNEKNNNEINNKKLIKFKHYLKSKLHQALKEEINNSIYKYKYTKGTRFGIGIYFKNTPGNLGSVSEWATYCSNPNSDLCEDNEPSFYFGSGTKPLTSMMVVSEIYKVWKKQNPNATNKEFLNFYAGPANNRGHLQH